MAGFYAFWQDCARFGETLPPPSRRIPVVISQDDATHLMCYYGTRERISVHAFAPGIASHVRRCAFCRQRTGAIRACCAATGATVHKRFRKTSRRGGKESNGDQGRRRAQGYAEGGMPAVQRVCCRAIEDAQIRD